MKFKNHINDRKSEIALLIGNGGNQYKARDKNSWDKLLVNLADRYDLPLEDG
jgi:hypothetical protein